MSALATPSRTETLEENFAWIRADAYDGLLLGAAIFVWLLLNVKLFDAHAVFPGWIVPIALLGTIVYCAVRRRDDYRRSALVFTAALFAADLAYLAAPAGPDECSVTTYLLGIVVLVADTLLGSRPAFVIAGLATVAVLAVPPLAGTTLGFGTLAGALSLAWLCAFASSSTTRSLYTALEWAFRHSEDADRRLAEARLYQGQLAKTNRQLNEALYQLDRANYSLEWARAQAEEARRIKAQFAANVSHELRTPINLVVGFTELMLDDPQTYGDEPLPRPYRTDLAAVYRSARHLRALIDDILDLSQIDAGEMPVLKETSDLCVVVREAVATARQLLDRKRLAVCFDLAPDLPALSLDRLRIRQVLLNLLSNASRFTDEGGVTIRACRSENGDEVVVTVQDTGLGIGAELLPKLFEAFYQGDGSVTRGRGGTGLGLAISKRFVELHGGRIWAESEGVVGRGSTFAFALPIAGAAPVAGDPHAGLSPVPPTSAEPEAAAVIVLDDDPAIVGLFQRQLTSYRVLGVTSIAEALAEAERLDAHAIIADVAAWRRDDGSLADWEEHAARAGRRVLLCPMPSGRRQARGLGLVDYLMKPVSRARLLESVDGAAPDARSVLVVDDDTQMARLLCRMLESAGRGYRTRRAADGEQALEMMRAEVPDLVLLDLLMPQTDGHAVLARMRAEAAWAKVPVIAVSAHGFVEAIAPSTSRSLFLLSEEPLSVSHLLGVVRTLLDALPPPVQPTRRGDLAPRGASLSSPAS
jgi:signal transduction histidine kinase/CheY-like chemotaxis protein